MAFADIDFNNSATRSVKRGSPANNGGIGIPAHNWRRAGFSPGILGRYSYATTYRCPSFLLLPCVFSNARLAH